MKKEADSQSALNRKWECAN